MTFDDCTLKFGETDVSAAYIGTTLVYSGGTQPVINYSAMPFTVVAESSGKIVFSKPTTVATALTTLHFSRDGGSTWDDYSSNDGDFSSDFEYEYNVQSGDTLQIVANNPGNWFYNGLNGALCGSTAQYHFEGNIMSLIYESFEFTDTLRVINQFYRLFNHCTGLTSAENLILPATAMTNTGYSEMFGYCTNLTTAPSVLPATTLGKHCYDNMFIGCTNLTSVPELPATTLAESCYMGMFNQCNSLINAPELPATTLTRQCYRQMFAYCTSLTTAPALPATILYESCYESMFYNCLSLNYIKCLATDRSASYCTNKWLNTVSATGTFVKDPNASWPTGEGGIPNNWTVVDAT